MTEVAGEVADGLIAHAFTTERYMREVTLPAVERGLAKGGRSREEFQVTCPAFIVTGADGKGLGGHRAKPSRSRLRSTGRRRPYRPVLELHGWGELQTELNHLSKQGKWVEMGGLIDDDILDAFAIVAEPAQVGKKLKNRYGELLDRMLVGVQLPDEEAQRDLLASLRA